MRRGSAAIVPLFLAIMILFWFIAFMGGADDNQAHLNQIENVKNIEQRLVTAAMIRKINRMEENVHLDTPLSESEVDTIVSNDIQKMMGINSIDKPATPASASNSASDSGSTASNNNQAGSSGQNNQMDNSQISNG